MTLLAPPNNSTALASFVLGLISTAVSFLIGFWFPLTALSILLGLAVIAVPAVLAVIFGFVGISTANRLGGRRRVYAVWGVVLGFTPLLWMIAGQLLSMLAGR